jgi:hypothetical protein
MLPARDGEPRGGIKRSSAAPNCSYFVNWTSVDDSMVWLLDVHTAGNYEVAIDYTCKVEDVGSLVELDCFWIRGLPAESNRDGIRRCIQTRTRCLGQMGKAR